VEDVVEESREIANTARRGAERIREVAKSRRDVYGWQEIILNRAAACAQCETGLGGGAPAFRGLRDDGGPSVFLCPACIRRLRRPASHEEESR